MQKLVVLLLFVALMLDNAVSSKTTCSQWQNGNSKKRSCPSTSTGQTPQTANKVPENMKNIQCDNARIMRFSWTLPSCSIPFCCNEWTCQRFYDTYSGGEGGLCSEKNFMTLKTKSLDKKIEIAVGASQQEKTTAFTNTCCAPKKMTCNQWRLFQPGQVETPVQCYNAKKIFDNNKASKSCSDDENCVETCCTQTGSDHAIGLATSIKESLTVETWAFAVRELADAINKKPELFTTLMFDTVVLNTYKDPRAKEVDQITKYQDANLKKFMSQITNVAKGEQFEENAIQLYGESLQLPKKSLMGSLKDFFSSLKSVDHDQRTGGMLVELKTRLHRSRNSRISEKRRTIAGLKAKTRALAQQKLPRFSKPKTSTPLRVLLNVLAAVGMNMIEEVALLNSQTETSIEKPKLNTVGTMLFSIIAAYRAKALHSAKLSEQFEKAFNDHASNFKTETQKANEDVVNLEQTFRNELAKASWVPSGDAENWAQESAASLVAAPNAKPRHMKIKDAFDKLAAKVTEQGNRYNGFIEHAFTGWRAHVMRDETVKQDLLKTTAVQPTQNGLAGAALFDHILNEHALKLVRESSQSSQQVNNHPNRITIQKLLELDVKYCARPPNAFTTCPSLDNPTVPLSEQDEANAPSIKLRHILDTFIMIVNSLHFSNQQQSPQLEFLVLGPFLDVLRRALNFHARKLVQPECNINEHQMRVIKSFVASSTTGQQPTTPPQAMVDHLKNYANVYRNSMDKHACSNAFAFPLPGFKNGRDTDACDAIQASTEFEEVFTEGALIKTRKRLERIGRVVKVLKFAAELVSSAVESGVTSGMSIGGQGSMEGTAADLSKSVMGILTNLGEQLIQKQIEKKMVKAEYRRRQRAQLVKSLAGDLNNAQNNRVNKFVRKKCFCYPRALNILRQIYVTAFQPRHRADYQNLLKLFGRVRSLVFKFIDDDLKAEEVFWDVLGKHLSEDLQAFNSRILKHFSAYAASLNELSKQTTEIVTSSLEQFALTVASSAAEHTNRYAKTALDTAKQQLGGGDVDNSSSDDSQ